jgi:hypothetical protein
VPADPQVAGRRGRTITAVGLALGDALDQLLSASLATGFAQSPLRAGGLRAGYVRATETRLEMHGVVYVPGVRVRGRIALSARPHGSLRVTGAAAANGRLTFRRDGSVTGRLAGRRVRVSGMSTVARAPGPRTGGSLPPLLRRLADWPPDLPARRPGRLPLPHPAPE